MSERKPRLVATAAGVIALLLAGGAAPASAAPTAVKKAVAKKVVKKPVKKATTKKKVVAKAVAAPLPPPVVLPPPPPQPEAYLGADTAPAPAGAYNDLSRYRYIDDADSLLDTVGTSPPDFAFTFDGVECWAWELDSGDMVLAEPVGDNYRFYAFAPGDQYPFFVGDDDYSYGFAGRTLAAVYDNDAQLVAWAAADAIPSQAAWLSDRGRAMKDSIAVRAPVIASDWASGITFFSGIELRFGDWRSQPGWSRYRIGTGSRHRRDWRARLGKEQATERGDRADRFDQWRRGGFRGAPPANKGGWNTAPGANRPGRPGWGPRPGGWNGPRPAAPATPGTPPRPRMDRPGNGQPGAAGRPGRSPRPGATPPAAQPGASTPPPPPGRDGPARGNWRGNTGNDGAATPPPTTGTPLPPPVYVAPPAGNNPPDRRGGRGGDRPIGSVTPPSSPNVPAPPALGDRPARGTRPVDRTAVASPPPPPVRAAPPPVRVAPPPPPPSPPPPVRVAPPPPEAAPPRPRAALPPDRLPRPKGQDSSGRPSANE